MFEQTFVGTQKNVRGPWSMAASLTVQAGLVGLVLLIPLLHPEAPTLRMETPAVYVPHIITQPPPTVNTAVPVPGQLPTFMNSILSIKTLVGPRNVVPLGDVPDTGVPTTIGPIAGPGILMDSLPVAIPEVALPKPVVKPADHQPAPPKQVRVGGTVQAASLIYGPKPAYPPLAKAARVQGTVKLQALIAQDGTIRNLQVAAGHPLLVRAAVDAVSQWRYRPTTLGGSPVEVITEILVNFALN